MINLYYIYDKYMIIRLKYNIMILMVDIEEITINKKTKKEIVELLIVKQDYEGIATDADSIISKLITNELHRIKDNNPTIFDLKQRNLRRIFDLKEKKFIYCPIIREYTENIMICHIACPFGHITECHYPYDCQLPYCNHFKQLKSQSEV